MTKQEMIDRLESYTGTPEENILGELYPVLQEVARSLEDEYNDSHLNDLLSDYRDAPAIIEYIRNSIDISHWELSDLGRFIVRTFDLDDYVYLHLTL